MMSEHTKIVQCFLPPMVAGKYTTEVNQRILKENRSIQDIKKTFDFGVDAARFTLNPNDIYSVYPPANKSGSYSESLPHLVFTRRTLPWERTIDGLPPVFQRSTTPEEKRNTLDSPPVPWMALLLFDEDEMSQLQIEKNTLAAVIQSDTADGIIRPEIFGTQSAIKEEVLQLMEWEKSTDGCFTIDLTKEQFETHVPYMESLSLLAHAKEVSIENKDKEGITDLNADGNGVFSVIVGNRLPASGKQNTAIVVSLEGHTRYLADASPKANIPTDIKIRLVVLASWNFMDSGNASFSQLVNSVDIKPISIQRENEAIELRPYFDSGYVPLEHLTRTGASTISWYHGPFVPKLFPSTSKTVSFSSSDAALRYDKTTGFFDISFAAAWQLGRILGLQNQEFAKALLNWRLAQTQFTAGKTKEALLNTILEDNSTLYLKDKVIHYLGAIDKVETELATEKRFDEIVDVPTEVKRFLNNLYSVNGIPFSYLLPHEFLLQKEHHIKEDTYSGTLSLFYVDPNWIEALLDGALSIGRVANHDPLLEMTISGQFIEGYNTGSVVIDKEGEIYGRRLNTTGFLFRSDLVSGWRGLEIMAFDAQNKALNALRFERIDSDIFLGIFNGNIARIIIKQPYEGLHFGLKIDKGGYKKNIKNEDGTNQVIVDGTADVNRELNNGLLKNRILDVAGLAAVMHKKLVEKDWMDTTEKSAGKYFTSAEFAFQMVDSPVKKEILIEV
ncbi:hypothetical protein [Flavobacterium lipolyticum]|uniref:Uncharacterized protein n=1 Tax=Flavobacterium lipolyticum TaxID=2893754 RepID=A0ABS8M6N0_9FLAO|nr:hypothetical protein [Flavobacterium sp. F-126]MCC9020465.1 hypothetical protein [Flavobacterium sp. F-126]